MFAVHVTVQVRPECREEFLSAIDTAARIAVRDEPGCHLFDVTEIDPSSNTFAFYELYTDAEAVEAGHRRSPHFRAWRQVADRVLVPGSQVTASGALLVTARKSDRVQFGESR